MGWGYNLHFQSFSVTFASRPFNCCKCIDKSSFAKQNTTISLYARPITNTHISTPILSYREPSSKPAHRYIYTTSLLPLISNAMPDDARPPCCAPYNVTEPPQTIRRIPSIRRSAALQTQTRTHQAVGFPIIGAAAGPKLSVCGAASTHTRTQSMRADWAYPERHELPSSGYP